MDIEKIAVLGAGNGGHACSADLSLAGYKVNLFNRSPEPIEVIRKRGGIEIIGKAREGFARLNKVTTNIKEAIEDVDMIMVVVPAFAHKFMAEKCAPYLKDGQIIILNPGHTGGALNFAKTLQGLGVKKDIKLGETMTLTYGTRRRGPAQVTVYTLVKKLLFATFPSKDTEEVTDVFKNLYPSVVPATNVLETSLTNLNAIIHPPGMILNAGWIENTEGDFSFYTQGLTQSVGTICEAVDEERLNLIKTLGFEPISFSDWYYMTGYTSIKAVSISEALQSSKQQEKVKAPSSMKHRYIVEDIPYGLVPMSSLGDMLNVSTPAMRSLIYLSSLINRVDYWSEGLTVRKLGISDLSLDDLNAFLQEGKR
jgi:opine dehydrogenase